MENKNINITMENVTSEQFEHNSIFRYVVFAIVIIFFFEIIMIFVRKLRKDYYYTLAKNRAAEINKKLLVIGDVDYLDNLIDNFNIFKDNKDRKKCGDLCIDFEGCTSCSMTFENKLEDIINEINLDEYVIYINSTLEFSEDLPLILNKLNKVKDENKFIVTNDWFLLSYYIFPYKLFDKRVPKYIIFSTDKEIKYTNNPFYY